MYQQLLKRKLPDKVRRASSSSHVSARRFESARHVLSTGEQRVMSFTDSAGSGNGHSITRRWFESTIRRRGYRSKMQSEQYGMDLKLHSGLSDARHLRIVRQTVTKTH